MDTLDSLVAAARSGGGWAFGRLWEELAPAVAGYMRARGVPDADDVTSEVFLAAFQSIGRFEGDGAQFRSWLFTIAHHKGVDALRAATKIQPTPYDATSDNRVSTSAEQVVLDAHANRELIDAINCLTADQRDVVLLRFVADLSLEQVSEVTGKPVGAVKQLQRR
ncbi:MAG TPA: sigma-70 family RNA polymerase sigma factor, partial [Actinomycetes bacterium]|nr:sigma-70 family RNA polymerase sigma factor [Actinomycetes bacterium]